MQLVLPICRIRQINVFLTLFPVGKSSKIPRTQGSELGALPAVSGQRERAQRRTVLQIVDLVPSLPTLDDPAPQMVDTVAVFFAALSPDPEQVIEVPKILPVDVPMRTMVREPQLAEQLVEVPTIVCFLELNVDIPVVGGSGAGGGLHGFLPGQNYSMTAEQIVANPVPRRCFSGDLQGFPQDRVRRSGLRTRSLTFQFQVEVLKILLKHLIVQGFRPICRTRQIKGFF